jgi:ribosomal protein S4E
MKLTHSQRNDFLAHRPLPGVRFEHNAYVHVVGGEHLGDAGSVVSVEQLGDDPVYLVELESNQDSSIPQSHLLAAEA